MFAKIKQVAAIGAAVAGIGWLTAVSPLAYAMPSRCVSRCANRSAVDPFDATGVFTPH